MIILPLFWRFVDLRSSTNTWSFEPAIADTLVSHVPISYNDIRIFLRVINCHFNNGALQIEYTTRLQKNSQWWMILQNLDSDYSK
jgi:hypothetical protein